MVWDVWKNGRIVASFERHELDQAYAFAVWIGRGMVEPRSIK